MSRKKKTFDPACLDLVRHFYPNTSDDNAARMAWDVQRCIDGWEGCIQLWALQDQIRELEGKKPARIPRARR